MDFTVAGMVHLPPLPGAPSYEGDRATIERRALADAEALVSGGVDAIVVENFGDAPFYPGSVPTHTVADMTTLVRTVTDAVDVPVGVNILRNDADEARETLERGRADGLIVSGSGTGAPTDGSALEQVSPVCREHGSPLIVGSGVTPETVSDYLEVADSVIVGTALKTGGDPTNPVEESRVRALVEAV